MEHLGHAAPHPEGRKDSGLAARIPWKSRYRAPVAIGVGGSTAHAEAMERFVIRPDAVGFSIIDIWSGGPAVLAASPQVGLPQSDPDHIAQLLNERAGVLSPAPSAEAT